MSLVTHFVNYAIRFEQAYAADDWSIVAPCFTEDAAYVVTGAPAFAGRHEGRDTLMGFFEGMMKGFDRRFGRRAVEATDGPHEKEGVVVMPWVSRYTVPGAPELRLDGTTTAHFRGDRISILEDHIPAESGERMMRWMAEHGSKLAVPTA